MKKIIVLISLFSFLFTTDRVKLDGLTNFSNFKKYILNIDANFLNTNRLVVPKSHITNGIFRVTIEAILFKGEEGRLEHLTKAQMDALPNTPYKHFLQRAYAYTNSSNFDRDWAFLFPSGEMEKMVKKRSETITNFFEIAKQQRIKKIIMAIRTPKNNLFFIYKQDFVLKNGQLSNHPWTKYMVFNLGKENDKWVEVREYPPYMNIWDYCALKSKFNNDNDDIFLNLFQEVN